MKKFGLKCDQCGAIRYTFYKSNLPNEDQMCFCTKKCRDNYDMKVLKQNKAEWRAEADYLLTLLNKAEGKK